MNKFIVDGRYAELLNGYGIRVEEALRKAELPGDTFCHKAPVMEEEAYYRFPIFRLRSNARICAKRRFITK